jgi:intraflagellar transport protein 172
MPRLQLRKACDHPGAATAVLLGQPHPHLPCCCHLVQVVFYDASTGRVQQSFDYSTDEEARDFASGTVSPGGDAMVFGAYHRMYMFSYSPSTGWTAAGHKQVDNFYTVSQLAWRPDGSCITAGGLTGAVDLWDACLRRSRHKGMFELTHVSSSAVIIKSLQTGSRTVIKSQSGAEIDKVGARQPAHSNGGRTG